MGEAFNYKRYFNEALDQVKALRDPYARKQESVEAGWYSILQHQIVNIGAADFKRPMDVIDGTNEISIVCIYTLPWGCPTNPKVMIFPSCASTLTSTRTAFSAQNPMVILNSGFGLSRIQKFPKPYGTRKTALAFTLMSLVQRIVVDFQRKMFRLAFGRV